MTTIYQRRIRSALVREAERRLDRKETRNEWIVVIVCLVGVVLLGVLK